MEQPKPQQLYPCLSAGQSGDQTFRLTKISEIDNFLTKEIEDRRKIQKKYQRAINIVQTLGDGACVTAIGLETVGFGLMGTGVGVIPGLPLAATGAGVGLLSLVCSKIRRSCTTKLDKHAAICQTARTKLNSIHQLVSKALSDSKITDEEFKTISDELDRYQTMKEELRAKARGVDNTTKKEWVEQGKAEARAELAEYMGAFRVPQK